MGENTDISHAIFQIRQDRFPQCAVKIFVHFRVFQKIAGIDACMKICCGKKSVMFAVNFAGPWRSRRTGDGIKKVSGFSQRLNDSGLSRARRSGDDEENSVPAESITQDFGLARGSSPVRPCSR